MAISRAQEARRVSPYDASGNRTAIVWPDAWRADYVDDGLNRLTEIKGGMRGSLVALVFDRLSIHSPLSNNANCARLIVHVVAVGSLAVIQRRFLLSVSAITLGLVFLSTPMGVSSAQAGHYVTCFDFSEDWSTRGCWHDSDPPDHKGGSDVAIANDAHRVGNYSGHGGSWDYRTGFRVSLTNNTIDHYGDISRMKIDSLTIGNSNDFYYPSELMQGGLRVAGDRAILEVKNTIYIGKNGGIGTLLVEQGGRVYGGNLFAGGYLNSHGQGVGGGMGTIQINDAGTIVRVKDIVAGANGSGYLWIDNGASVYADNFHLNAWSGAVDHGSTLTVAGDVKISPVPSNGGDNIFRVANGGTLSATTIHVPVQTYIEDYYAASLLFDGGTLHLQDLDGNASTPATTIFGNLRHTNGMTLKVDAALLDHNPDLVVHGNISALTWWTRNYGMTITVVPSANGYAPVLDQSFVVIKTNDTDASGAQALDDASGPEFAAESGLHFVDANVSQVGGDILLTFNRNAVGFGDHAVSGNESKLGDHVESLGSGHAVHDAFLGLSNHQNLRTVYNAVMGEGHSAAVMAVNDAAAGLGNIVTARATDILARNGKLNAVMLAEAPRANAADAEAPIYAMSSLVNAGTQIWARAFGSTSTAGDTAGTGEHDAQTGGVAFGGDIAVDGQARVGLAVGVSNSSVDHDSVLSDVSVDSAHAVAYGGKRFDNLVVTGGLGITYSQLDSARRTGLVALPGELVASYDALSGQAFVEVAYDVDAEGILAQPFASFELLSTRTDGHTETGGPAALTTASSTQTHFHTTLGVRLSDTIELDPGQTLSVSAGAGWRHLFGDDTHDRTVQFAGGPVFDLIGPAVDADTLALEAGVEYRMDQSVALALEYEGHVGDDSDRHAARLTVSYQY